ncbi:MAG: hypothetical protein ACJAS1_005818 [Oleiphilaceae bacterium]|jgi:hypothetical protein
MKWLLLLLVAVNVILFVVQAKEKDGSGLVGYFQKVPGAQEIKLLKADHKNIQDRCVVIGAIPEPEALEVVVGFLTSSGIHYEQIEKEIILAPSYWVHIVDIVDEALIKSLNDKGIGSYLIAAGELKGKLSVGLFANIDLAQNKINSLKKLGINAGFIEKRKAKKTQWVSFSINEIEGVKHIIGSLKDMQINLGEIKEFFCKSIASEK